MLTRRRVVPVLALACPAIARAQRSFPSRPVRLVLGFNAGGGADTMVRVLAEHAAPLLGQPMVVENRGGAGGGLAAGFLRAQPADGHVVGYLLSSAFTLNPLLGQVAYRQEDFALVTILARQSAGLLARADAPFSDWASFLAWAKGKGAVSFATAPLPSRLVMERVAAAEGFRLRVVQSRGGAETRAMLLGGHVDIGFGGGSAFEQTRPGGPFRLLALFDPERNADVPETPTLRELGVPYGFADHYVVIAPAGTPGAALSRLTEVLHEAASTAQVRLLVDNNGWAPMATGAEAAARILATEADAYRRLAAGQALPG